MTICWTYKDWYDDSSELEYYDFNTKLDAIHSVEAEYNEANDDIRHGEQREAVCQLYSYEYNDDGEVTILSQEPYKLFIEGYHGDLKEHGTWR